MNFAGHSVDYPSMLAYESLVGSSLQSLIKIDTKNILIVDDVESIFKLNCNVVRKGDNGFLDNFQEEVEIKNKIWDGMSLLDESYFTDGKGMKLLRNHMFKSCAFNCKVQQWFQDNCPRNINYDEWQVKNMFNESIYVKDVHLIITPSSLKALKFAHVVTEKQEKLERQKDMWNYWRAIVEAEGNIFGVCKSEKQSKHGKYQQTSYQMINSLPAGNDDIQILADYEKEYIKDLKNNDDFFIEHIGKYVNEVNSNQMWVDIYNQNKRIVNTNLFRKFRTEEIHKHANHVRKGKIRLTGDYAVLCGNPIELLKFSIGCFDVNSTKSTLKMNEIYTTLFKEGKELVCFRNPHTSPSNVFVARNIRNTEIQKYINLTDNIVCVNTIRYPLPDILNGCDFDSDTMLIV
ncbi:hypothetical protein M3691_37025, partial [Paenibacillus elgii]|nr:hypothetical protein [Paenibacillus elgii]